MDQNLAYQLATQGQQAMQVGMYEQAARFYSQALQHAPQSDALHYHYASAMAWRGLPYDALTSLDRCVALRGPWLAQASQLAAQIRSQMGLPAVGVNPMGPPPMGVATPPVGVPAGPSMGMATPPAGTATNAGMNTPPAAGGMGMSTPPSQGGMGMAGMSAPSAAGGMGMSGMSTPPAAGGMGMSTPPSQGGMGMSTPPSQGGMGMTKPTDNTGDGGMSNPNVKTKKKRKFWGAAVKVIGKGAIGGIKALSD